ncbi:MAG: hypothetical protein ACT4OU_03285 [Hyphomicrobium sp.]
MPIYDFVQLAFFVIFVLMVAGLVIIIVKAVIVTATRGLLAMLQIVSVFVQQADQMYRLERHGISVRARVAGEPDRRRDNCSAQDAQTSGRNILGKAHEKLRVTKGA